MDYDFDLEIDRKVSEAIHHIALSVNDKRMTHESAYHATHAIFMATQGLTSGSVGDLVCEASEEFSEAQAGIFPVVIRTQKGNVIVVRVNLVKFTMTVTVEGDGISDVKKHSYENERQTLAAAVRIATKFINQGGKKC